MIHSGNPWQPAPARLVRVHEEITGVSTFDFVLDGVQHPFTYAPGQFNMLYVPGVGEAAISLSGMTGPVLHHTIREAGNVTHAITQLKPGMSIGMRGPFGTAWPMDQCHGKDIIVVAGGIGLAPVRPVIHAVLQEPQRFGKLTILHGARSPAGLLYGREYDNWRNQGIQVEVIVDRADEYWNGQVGVITQLLDRLAVTDPAETVLMTCGPEVMMHFVAKAAMSKSIPEGQIWLSLERHMNCAIGHCGHCQLGGTFVCKDGPVFRYDHIRPLMAVEGL
ncbi:MAG: FAD/NAD(P)-binding protein [Planctomycetia bacterium]|nr:FAD/NAD(P)-binding protein [Planctomycetia bacterium]